MNRAAVLLSAYAAGQRDFPGADLTDAYLRWANLTGANLYNANLTNTNLRGAYLYNAYLRGANLTEANLTNAYLTNTNLRGAYLYNADLRGADLTEANLTNANLTNTNLTDAYLRGANLRGANLTNANLTNTNLSGAYLPHFQICPEEGSFIGYKKLDTGVIALTIPAESKRTSSLVGRKCRAEFALPMGSGTSNNGGVYVEGQMYYPDSYDDDIRVECTHGVHFFITRREAEEYDV